jgi:hypothetical protein
MPKFILQSDGERSAIAEEVLPGFRPDSSLFADDWLDAKRAFGFELTEMQEALLPLNPEERRSYLALSRWESVMRGLASGKFLRHESQGRVDKRKVRDA